MSPPSCCGTLGRTTVSLDEAWRLSECLLLGFPTEVWTFSHCRFVRGASPQHRGVKPKQLSNRNSSEQRETFLHLGKSPSAKCWNFQAIVPLVAGISKLCQTMWFLSVFLNGLCHQLMLMIILIWIKFSPQTERRKSRTIERTETWRTDGSEMNLNVLCPHQLVLIAWNH